MRNALIGACVPLIEARLGAIEVGGYGNAPRGVQRVSAAPWGVLDGGA